MPYKADEPSVSWISDSTDLKAAVRDFESVVGIDSEFKRTNTFYPIPALYQVASGQDVFLLDPLLIKDWSALVEFLEDENKLKVFHACQEDLELVASHMGAVPRNVFDTQFAYAFLSPLKLVSPSSGMLLLESYKKRTPPYIWAKTNSATD